MILNLSNRRSPLDVPPSGLGRLCRMLLSFGLVLAAVAAGIWAGGRLVLEIGVQQGPVAVNPQPASAGEPWEPNHTEFRARGVTEVYREPWVESGLIGRLHQGDRARILRRDSGWLLLDTPFGPGWVDTAPRVWPPAARPTPWRLTLPPVTSSEPPEASAPPEDSVPPPNAPVAVLVATPRPEPEPERLARQIDAGREDSPAIAWARERISRAGTQQLESENFRLWTDLPDSSRLGFLLGLAEQTRRRFRALFAPHFELEDLAGRNEVYLFRRRADYLEFYRLFSLGGAAAPSGHYSIDLRTIALSEQSVPGNTMAATLVHEMVHLLLDQSLYRHARQPRPWIGEGLACTLAYTAGGEEGRVARVQTRIDRLGVGPAAQERIRGVQQEMQDGVGLRLETLLQAEDSAFQGPSGIRYYDGAWLLCQFLLYGEGGRNRPLLMAAIAADRTGPIPQETLAAIRDLEPRFRQWVLHLRRG